MSHLKIPFGLQGDTIVMIEDISPEARGRKCNCVCPSCKAPLLARLGEIRTHHFAHSGEGCDEQIAFLSGLYQMVQEYILNNEIVLPKLEVFWGYKRTKFTRENFFDRIRFSPAPGFEEKILIAQESRIKFEKSEIVCTGKTPTALILEVKSRQMAICIRPPANICKVFSVKPYKNMATLEMNGSGIPFGELKKEQIIKALRKELENSRWNYNSKALKAIDDINKANDVWLEIIRKREEKEKKKSSKVKNSGNCKNSFNSNGSKDFTLPSSPSDNRSNFHPSQKKKSGRWDTWKSKINLHSRKHKSATPTDSDGLGAIFVAK